MRKETSPSWWQQKNAPVSFQEFQPLFPISPEKTRMGECGEAADWQGRIIPWLAFAAPLARRFYLAAGLSAM
ncbi:MAG: hypothetical protein ACLSUW_01315 [Akkermansia sp.]